MGIFSDMFGDKPETAAPRGPETLGVGEFVYDGADVLAGYTVFRRRYVYKRTALFVLLSALALASSIMMLMSEGTSMFPLICTAISALVLVWFIKTPIENAHKTKKAAAELHGEHYAVEITTATVKITLLTEDETGDSTEKTADSSAEVDNTEKIDNTAPLVINEGTRLDDEPYEAPATIIHLDQFIVDIIDTADSYVIVVAKKYVFVIPHRAFSDEENERIAASLMQVMEMRFKVKKRG